jgi:hypothetical protein
MLQTATYQEGRCDPKWLKELVNPQGWFFTPSRADPIEIFFVTVSVVLAEKYAGINVLTPSNITRASLLAGCGDLFIPRTIFYDAVFAAPDEHLPKPMHFLSIAMQCPTKNPHRFVQTDSLVLRKSLL